MSDSFTLPSNTRWSGAAQWYPEAPPWKEDAACRGTDPDVFFPSRGEDLVVARAVCAGCPVRGECLDFALAHNEKFGVWGGLSERERRRVRRGRREMAHGPDEEANTAARYREIHDDRQRQVRSMRSVGLTNREIAVDLGLSARTVARYLEAAS